MEIKYKRILLKLSGESLMGNQASGIDTNILMQYVQQIAGVVQQGIQVGLVVGGGNIFRGLQGVEKGFDRVKGDQMGMLATVINGLGLQSAFESIGQPARLMTAVRTEPIGEYFSKDKAIQAFNNKEVVIFSGGTGCPFFTTDTTAALRALEISADVLLKGTRVDGIYTADPEKNSDAVKYTSLTFDEAIDKNLKIMDLTAFALCKENKLPILVFDMNTYGNLLKVLTHENIGTIVK